MSRQAPGPDAPTVVGPHDEGRTCAEAPANLPEAPWVGRRFGPYRTVAEIGRGGMGTVYRAVREDDAFHKEVALKLVRTAGGGEARTGRFRRERQILARLQHPNIAALYDGGTSDEGQPFLVMELVEGEPLDRYCASRGLGLRGRIALFRTICAAVHHAHQALVVHRDLKPANILVTGDGVPKLLDFGIARLLAGEDDTDGAPTATMLPHLTPDFASPEQVRGEAVTTATDVYSLGVVLYELLTGRPPYVFATRALEEVARVVCGVHPTRPSQAVTAGGPATSRKLAGDLDTILLKCLQKEADRRYGSVAELSDDLQRYLDGRPLLARPDTLGYRAGKFLRRHRVGVAASAVAVVSLVTGTGVALRQARIAEANRERAERRFQDVRRLAGSLLFDLHDQIVNLPGSLGARQALIAKAEQYLETLLLEAGGDRDLQRELAAAYQRLGDVQGSPRTANAGDLDGALRSYGRAHLLREALARAGDAEPRDAEDLAFLLFARGALLRVRGEDGPAEATFTEAAALLETRIAGGRTSRDLRSRLAGVYQRLSEVQARAGKREAADASAARAVRLAQAHVAEHPDDTAGRTNLAAAYHAQAERLAERGELRAALLRLGEARAIQEALRREQPLDTNQARALGYTLNASGKYHEGLGELPEAVRSYEEGAALAAAMARADPRDHYARLAVAVAGRSLGAARVRAGDRAAGIARLRAALTAAEAILRDDPANGFAREEVLATGYRLGTALLETRADGSRAEGCRILGQTLASWDDLAASSQVPAGAAEEIQAMRERTGRCAPGRADERAFETIGPAALSPPDATAPARSPEARSAVSHPAGS